MHLYVTACPKSNSNLTLSVCGLQQWATHLLLCFTPPSPQPACSPSLHSHSFHVINNRELSQRSANRLGKSVSNLCLRKCAHVRSNSSKRSASAQNDLVLYVRLVAFNAKPLVIFYTCVVLSDALKILNKF